MLDELTVLFYLFSFFCKTQRFCVLQQVRVIWLQRIFTPTAWLHVQGCGIAGHKTPNCHDGCSFEHHIGRWEKSRQPCGHRSSSAVFFAAVTRYDGHSSKEIFREQFYALLYCSSCMKWSVQSERAFVRPMHLIRVMK